MDSVVDCLVAAAPTGPALYEQFHKKFPQTVIRDAWGMTGLAINSNLALQNSFLLKMIELQDIYVLPNLAKNELMTIPDK